ncbi:hypothetical protein D9M71_673800 [compost metagenome]
MGARPFSAQNTVTKAGTDSNVIFSAQVRHVRPNNRSARASTGAPAMLTAAPHQTSSSGKPSIFQPAAPFPPGLAKRLVNHSPINAKLVGKATLPQNNGVCATSVISLRTP